jgi:type II secretory pathway pseudopilin PulG
MSLVEVLTVVAIIALLGAMLLLGFKYIGASSKARTTHVRLESLRNMLNEFEVRGGKMRVIDDVYDPPPPAIKSGTQWTIGKREVAPKGNLSEERGLRTSDPAVKAALDRTALVMLAITSVPECRSLLEQMPAEAKMNWTITIGSPSTSITVPIILDGWNNPVLYAPRRVQTRWIGVGAPDMNKKPTNSEMQWGIDDGMPMPVHMFQPMDGKGLWVSAGPDADLTFWDDNVYSVEK